MGCFFACFYWCCFCSFCGCHFLFLVAFCLPCYAKDCYLSVILPARRPTLEPTNDRPKPFLCSLVGVWYFAAVTRKVTKTLSVLLSSGNYTECQVPSNGNTGSLSTLSTRWGMVRLSVISQSKKEQERYMFWNNSGDPLILDRTTKTLKRTSWTASKNGKKYGIMYSERLFWGY